MSLEATNARSSSRGKFGVFWYYFILNAVCSFTGSARQAIITKNSAYLFVDSRYWVQAENEVDINLYWCPWCARGLDQMACGLYCLYIVGYSD